MQKCALTAHVSTKLNRSHLIHGREALILPCLGRSEVDVQAGGPQQVTVEDSMSMVHASEGRLEPISDDLRSEPAIVAGIAAAALPDSSIPWLDLAGDYTRIRDHISRVIPGFENFEQRLQQPGGFYLKGGAREREWRTASGKAHFVAHDFPRLGLPPGQLRLMTMRSHDQYNTTIYGLSDRYRGIQGERMVVFMHADDIADFGLNPEQRVRLVSIHADGERAVSGFRPVPYDIPRGCAAAYFPEANPLVSVASYAERSRTPTSKFIPIRIEKTAEEN